MDISPVTFPAQPTTDVAVRSPETWQEAQGPVPMPKLDQQRRRVKLAEADD